MTGFNGTITNQDVHGGDRLHRWPSVRYRQGIPARTAQGASPDCENTRAGSCREGSEITQPLPLAAPSCWFETTTLRATQILTGRAPTKLNTDEEIFRSGTSVDDPNVNISASLPIDDVAAHVIIDSIA